MKVNCKSKTMIAAMAVCLGFGLSRCSWEKSDKPEHFIPTVQVDSVDVIPTGESVGVVSEAEPAPAE
jgi:hypothetical protein